MFVNSELKDYEFDRIVMDYEQGLGDMVSYLLQQKKYRSIGYIGGIYQQNGIEIGVHRLHRLKAILMKRNCMNEDYFRIGELSREDGYRLTLDLLETGDVPEVLILGNDKMQIYLPTRLCIGDST